MTMHSEHIAELSGLLRNMDACARNLEQIGERERLATIHLDAEALTRLTDLRSRSHQALATMEDQVRKLLARCGAPPEMSLSAFIDTQAAKGGGELEELQALRRSLYQRMLRVQACGNESRLYLKAAHDVTIGVLQHIGAIEARQTYGPREPA